MTTEERILIAAKDLFWKYGIKSITMDDICKELGISKKTLYQYFEDKDKVVQEITKLEIDLRQVECERLCMSSKNAIHEILLMLNQMSQMSTTVHSRLFFDLQKYHPVAWKIFIDHKDSFVLAIIENNLLRGIAEGLYRPEINIKIISRLRTNQVEMAFNPTIFPPEQFSAGEIQMQLIEHFLYGIATDKGRKMILKLKQDSANNILKNQKYI